ncbi:MAG: hypothetical protein U9O95_03225 [Candidatus Marinimicrobia bacterium]|nr:hypothetical protein [Candidatus Neomarinimicrobiota bacterium]
MLKKITILSLCLLMLTFAVDPNYYIRRANLNFRQVNDMVVDLRIRSRMPEATLPDRETVVYFIRPDSLYTEDNIPLMIPPEIFLMDLERLVKDATSLRTIELDENKDNVAFVEVVKPMEGKDVIFLAMIDTVNWILTQMKMIDKPEMVADINFIQEEVQPGLFLPKEIKVMIESKETQKKIVPNPRGNMPMSSSFGYIDLSFSNYRINTLLDTVIVNDPLETLNDSLVIEPDTLK